VVVIGGVVPEGSGVVLMARVLGQAGQPILQNSVNAIAFTLTDLTNAAALGSGSFPVSGTVYDSLQQQDPRWRFDSATRPGDDGYWGYNFLAVLGAALAGPSAVTAPAVAARASLQCDVFFTPAQGEPFRVPFRWQRYPVFG
jgi:hypothetical protein